MAKVVEMETYCFKNPRKQLKRERRLTWNRQRALLGLAALLSLPIDKTLAFVVWEQGTRPIGPIA